MTTRSFGLVRTHTQNELNKYQYRVVSRYSCCFFLLISLSLYAGKCKLPTDSQPVIISTTKRCYTQSTIKHLNTKKRMRYLFSDREAQARIQRAYFFLILLQINMRCFGV